MTPGWRVRDAVAGDFAAWGALRAALWPDEPGVDADDELRAWLDDPGKAALLALDDAGQPIGFAELALRRDYVNGTAGSPVGFLEGWFVAPGYRGRGVGKALIDAAEAWSRAQGCGELASDALLDNIASQAAHAGCGFEETERVVYFRKVLA